ncbi:SEC-C metal-binding domain-containing protein [Lignipirellula cremea]|uniref:SEC-C metal-binding domain-containing protein n=1 Tax=Lignipirellula cremea TaxID=2528010 RepID=UPI0018D24D87|nr:SEC-C metal-binding domain-containing protein [Lignipirellula cremea]
MRLAESKIKEAILHPDPPIRQRAIRYFSESFSTDASIMPLVIRSVETYGRDPSDLLIFWSRKLPQTKETIDWIVGELRDEQIEQTKDYARSLREVLATADASLLSPMASSLFDTGLPPEINTKISERLEMLSWDEARCWQELEKLCEEGKDASTMQQFNLNRSRQIVEALARFGNACEEKVLSLLQVQTASLVSDPMIWMEPMAVELAGRLRLESAVPLLIAKLRGDIDDMLNEGCAESLSRIGTPAVLEAIAAAWTEAPDHFRLYGSTPLGCVHTDLAVEKCLQLLPGVNDDYIRPKLAQCLLAHFDPEGIEIARQMLLHEELGFMESELRIDLIESCIIMDEQFPELDAWRAAEEAQKAAHQKWVAELEGDPAELLRFAIEKLSGKKRPKAPPAKPAVLPPASPPAASRLGSVQKVGRNSLCPCGSGKKYKVCCLRKQRG